MRYVIFLLCIALALTSAAMVAGAITVTKPTVTVTDYTIDPAVFIPGDNGTLTLTITNKESSASETTITTSTTTAGSTSTTSTAQIKTKIEDVHIHSTSIKSLGTDKKRVIYENPGALSPGESMTITFPLEVDVEDGKYFPEVWITVENGINPKYPIPITVDSSPVTILPIDIPREVSLKSSRLIQLAVANTRPNSIKGAKITPQSESFEFTPENIFIGDMTANEEVKTNFTLTPLDGAAREGMITFQLEFKNGDNSHTSTLERGVKVVEDEDLRVIVASYPESIPKGGSGTIELDIANGRSSDLSSVRVIPTTDEGLTTSPSEVFIGDMEQDDIFSAEFEMRAASSASDLETVSFKAIFRDIGNDKLYETDPITVTIKIAESEEDSPAFSAVFLLVAFLIASLIIQIKRKKRNE